jgi:predicted metal-dependent phosphoesterase TrpH
VIDLHLHSIFSDGFWTPEELVAEAVRHGLTAVALTDHDTTRGVPRFLEAAQRCGLCAVPGVEISAQSEFGAMHILGYFLRHRDPRLCDQLDRLREARDTRNRRILERLAEAGCPLSAEEVEAEAGGHVVGRPHFARAMIRRGYVKDKQEAFDKYLARGKAAYVGRRRFSPEESIRILREAGGVPVLAHPFTLGLEGAALRTCLVDLAGAGLEGVEVYYPQHGRHQQARYLKLAADLGLVPTGGSDFHGEAASGLRMGVGFGRLRVPDDIVPRLQARKTE